MCSVLLNRGMGFGFEQHRSCFITSPDVTFPNPNPHFFSSNLFVSLPGERKKQDISNSPLPQGCPATTRIRGLNVQVLSFPRQTTPLRRPDRMRVGLKRPQPILVLTSVLSKVRYQLHEPVDLLLRNAGNTSRYLLKQGLGRPH